MLQNYIIFKKHTPIEIKNQYLKESIAQDKVHIVINTIRKYTRIDYDFYILKNTKQSIKDSSTCNIEEKIKVYAFKYAKDYHLPSGRRPKVISNVAGGFEFYIEDVEQVGNDIAKIIEDILKSSCMEFTTLEEKLQSLNPTLPSEMEAIYAK